jgi:O-antigen/teichoic acid export membrane protein
VNLKQLIKHKFFKGSFIVMAATAVNSVLNYLYHLITVRNVTVSQYGTIQSLISLNYVFTIFTGAFSLAIISELGDKPRKKISSYTAHLAKLALRGSLIVLLILLVLYPLISDFLHLKSFSPFFIFSLQHGIIFLPVLYQSVLKARLKFWQSSLANILATAFKIITIIFLFQIGLKTNGALWGWVSHKLILLIASAFFVYQLFKPAKEKIKKLNFNFWKFSLISLITNFALTTIYTFDILLVKHWFTANQAGVYSATSTIGKIIFFIANSILIVAYPLFSKYKKSKPKLKKLIKLSAVSMLILIAVGLGVYYFGGELILNTLLTTDYANVAPYLFSFGVFISLTSIFNLIIRFFLAVESNLSLCLSLPIALGQVLLISLRHQTLFEVINSSIIMLTVGIVIGTFFIVKYFHHESKEKRS